VETDAAQIQRRSEGTSTSEIHDGALALAQPRSHLRWIDIGAGTGQILRSVRDRWSPAGLVSIDLLPWLAADLRGDVEMRVGDPTTVAGDLAPADRVLMVETLEHVEAPWTLLRVAARLLKPGGILVVTTPNILTLRHRLELLVRGQLTSFRPAEPQHLTPILPHIAEQIMGQEGLVCQGRRYASADVVPFARGRPWPRCVAGLAPSLLTISVMMAGQRP